MKNFEDIQQLVEISHRIATSGQPTGEQLEAAADRGYEVVINLGLHDADYSLEDEAAWVEQLGMKYIHIPVVFDAPQLMDLTRFINAMTLHQDKKCLVHCALNMRVSVFISLYQIIANEITPEEGWLHVNSVWEPDVVWTQFFNDAIKAFSSVVRNDA